MSLARFLCLALITPAAAHPVDEPPTPRLIEVVVLAGQSNADGRAPGAALPDDLRRPVARVDFYSHIHGEPANADGSLGRLDTLRPGRTQFPAGAFGPEITLGRRLADELARTRPDVRLALIKYAKGGSSLSADWKADGSANADKDGPHYRIFQRVVRDGLAALRTAYPGAEIRLAGLAWVQGETDVAAEAAAAAYEANLTDWIADVRATFTAPEMRIAVARLSMNQHILSAPEKPTRDRFLAMRARQARVAEKVPGTVLVDTDPAGFTFLPDQLHYDAGGQMTLGNALAVALLPHPTP